MNPVTTSAAAPGKYLTAVLDGEAYGISVKKVREIIRLEKITAVPQLPDYVRGVINLRGRVVPVMDLRTKLGLQARCDDRTCIIVVHINGGTEKSIVMGLIVDRVEEVANLTADQISTVPEFGCRIDASCLMGMAKVNGQVKTLLDIDRVISADLAPAMLTA
jgi:purine-binding chemotaxis protein CheW